jgi:hypothetical protein
MMDGPIDRPFHGHRDILPILRAGRAAHSVQTPMGWTHLDMSKDAFDRAHFLAAVEEAGKEPGDTYTREPAWTYDLQHRGRP